MLHTGELFVAVAILWAQQKATQSWTERHEKRDDERFDLHRSSGRMADSCPTPRTRAAPPNMEFRSADIPISGRGHPEPNTVRLTSRVSNSGTRCSHPHRSWQTSFSLIPVLTLNNAARLKCGVSSG
jgi:hypothetical protein